MRLRNMTPADLARESGVSKATISLILSDRQTNTTAVNVAKFARALNVSSDYLFGLSNDPEPRKIELGEMMMELTRVARRLPNRKQRDLLTIARAYLENHQDIDEEIMMEVLFEAIRKLGGQASLDRLLHLLNRDDGEARRLLGEDDAEQPSNDNS
jgi:transcriptional regulator with XRE-family HTH domain